MSRRFPTLRSWTGGAAGLTLAALVVVELSRRGEEVAVPAPAASCVTTRPSRAITSRAMTVLCDDVYAEAGLDARELDDLRRAREEAGRSLRRVFGTQRSTPLVLFCRSAACKAAFGAPSSAAAADDLGFASAEVALDDGSVAPSAVVVTGPVSGTARILTHELVHAEMKAWAPYDAIPTWFNEGAATFVANEPACDPARPPSDVDVTSLTTKARWQRHLQASGKTRETYCAARAQVATWMGRFETDALRGEALATLLTSVAKGTRFDDALDAVR